MKGPLPLRVSIKSAALRAAAKVLKLPASTAVSTISFSAAAKIFAAMNADATTKAPNLNKLITILHESKIDKHHLSKD